MRTGHRGAAGDGAKLSRASGKRLGETWGQGVVVENVVGAGGVIGIQALAKGAADGHAIGMIASNFAMNPAVHSKLPYDSVRDFKPVLHLTFNHFAFAVNPALPVSTLQELVALAKAKPGSIDYGSSGSGGSPHLAVEMLAHMAGIKLSHIPYRSNGDAVTAVLGGQVSLIATSASTLLPHITQGKLRALAVSGSKRTALLPDVPTAAEAGVPGYDMRNWNGILAPAGVPDAIVAKIQADITRIFKRPDFESQIVALGAEIELLGPEEFGRRIGDEIELWQRIVKESGARVG
ncbi:MAG: tripartite tricarboxylate transporter substrate-binding protein [Proteobacteria bacterium]|nr:tripartite tricarboxylate transporter substrate-binding protein [Pseudomonadota bacterium]